MRTARRVFACALVASALAAESRATLITFTGGSVVRHDASTETTNNTVLWDDVDYYVESGFKLDFTPNTPFGSSPFGTHVGNYYGAGNDVIHSHWATGNYGLVQTIEITKVGGGTFDLNYFDLTSNTDTGGGQASGNEQAWIRGYYLGNPTGGPQLLPAQDWGFPAVQVALNSDFSAVDKVVFYVTNPVDCFGMDDFYIDEIPAPGAVALLGLGGLVAGRRRRPLR